MGAFVAKELMRREPRAEVVIIDADAARAASLAATLSPTTVARACDARATDDLAALLRGCAVTVNAAQYDINLDVMRACLAAHSHYLDLGGMFHTTRRQLTLSAEFAAAGLTAVLGMGAAPGLTNVLSRAACDELDTVERIELSFAVAAAGAPSLPVFAPPYSMRTIMQEFSEESVQFIDGEFSTQPALAGRRRITFPDPIGAVDCVFTLHSEPATLPHAFAAKGVREVTWRLGLPAALEDTVRAFAAAGLGGQTPIKTSAGDIVPVDFLAECIEQNLASLTLTPTTSTEYGCARAEVTGRVGAMPTTVSLDSFLEASGAPPDLAAIITGTPAAVAAVMLARGEAALPGVHGPEAVIPPALLFARLRDSGFLTRMTRTQVL
ncbi:MAG: saccharopine dehydrogenase NADP-binding domain-containing protein [Gammaproteobacteria bacterium]|jgi:lysine 6-dehydrogenase|nr:saccharopine dehydrogenase NADP-binding domain-containing protein [Gammaproteobacteria bacterium]